MTTKITAAGTTVYISGDQSDTVRPISSGGTGADNASDALDNLGAQAQADILDALGTLTPAAMKMMYFDTNGDPQLHTVTALSLGLIDDGNTSSMQTTLGLGNAATHTVQSSAADATADRVLKVGALLASLGADVYGRGNIIGTTSQSGGTPTGALMRFQDNANGFGVRLACNFQIVVHTLTSSSSADVTWTFPMSFISNPYVWIQPLSAGFVNVSDWVTRSTTDMTFSVRNTSGVRQTTVCALAAIGKWF